MKQMAHSVLPLVYDILTPGSFICIYGEIVFFPVTDQNPDSFLKISVYPLKNLTGEALSLIFLLNGKITLTEKLQYFLTL